MGKILGANPAPEQMQTARSWKCVSATKAAAAGSAGREGWFQQLHQSSPRTSSGADSSESPALPDLSWSRREG